MTAIALSLCSGEHVSPGALGFKRGAFQNGIVNWLQSLQAHLASRDNADELPANPELLEQVHVRGSVITIDVMGRQGANAKPIPRCR